MSSPNRLSFVDDLSNALTRAAMDGPATEKELEEQAKLCGEQVLQAVKQRIENQRRVYHTDENAEQKAKERLDKFLRYFLASLTSPRNA